jgi:uncharacterized membrane protein YjjP (DUF1212 family)
MADSDSLDLDAKLDVLIRAGMVMLENGAATYRIAETLTRLGQALALDRVESFATPTGLILEVSDPEGTLSQVRRVTNIGVNMNRLALIGNLSRDAAAGQVTQRQIAERLLEIEQHKNLYPNWMVMLGVSIACGAFALLFGGGRIEFAATLVGAALAMLVRIGLRPVQLVPLMTTAAAAFVATAASSLTCRALGCAQPDVVPVAAVLQLVPGVPLVTSVIDLATGDIISGVSRGAYATLIAFGIGLGMLLFLVWGL